MHTYDIFGWYSGQDYPARDAGIAPSNISQTTTPGELRANWTGYAWEDLPYEVPPEILPVPVINVPQSVSPRQIRQALTRFGLRAAVESAIAAADQDLKDWYEFATEFERSNPKVAELAAALGVTDEQLDNLWILAGAL